MKRHLFIVVAAALTLSCAPRPRTAAARPAKLPRTAMERQIINAVDAGDGDYQVRALREKMAADPDNLQVRLDLASTYQQRGFPELALEHYRLAATRFPDSAELQLRLVKTLRELDMQREAIQSLEAFLKLHPQKSAEFPAWLGILHDELGQWAVGETAHREALAVAPGRDYLHNNLGYNLLRQGKAEEAAAEFRQALQLNPSSVVARNNLGVALASQPEKAILNWQSAGDPASAHSNMAAVLIEQGRYAEARKELDIALGYNKLHSAALNNLRLVSQLDGKPATIHVQPAGRRWAKLKSAVRKLAGAEPEKEGTSVRTASTDNGRGL